MQQSDFVPFTLEICEKYPGFKVRFVKGKHIDDIKKVTLTDLGFPEDLPPINNEDAFKDGVLHSFYKKTIDTVVGNTETIYLTSLIETGNKDCAFGELLTRYKEFGVTESELTAFLKHQKLDLVSARQAQAVLDEFIFIIEKLVPRSIQDLYYFLGLDTRPLYWVFFDMASEKLGLERYTDNGQTYYGQIIKTHMQDGVTRYLKAGVTLLDIYEQTCATKTIIRETLSDLEIEESIFDLESRYIIEKTLFGIKSCRYKRDVYFDDFMKLTGASAAAMFDFAVYYNGELSFVIIFDDKGYRYHWNINDSKGCFVPNDDYANEKEEYCHKKMIPVLKISATELWLPDYRISDIIRKALKSPETINNDRIEYHVAKMLDQIDVLPYENRVESKYANTCGCYACGEVFFPEKITEWFNERACCPFCGQDTVIFDSQGFDITEEIMQMVSKIILW